MNPILSNTPRLLLTLAIAGPAFSGQANACSLDIKHPSRYPTCLYNEAVDAGTSAGNAEYNRLINAANSQAGDIKKAATNDAKTIRDTADQQSRDIAAAATKALEQFRASSAAISQDEYNTLVAVYDQSLQASQTALTALATTALSAKSLDQATATKLRAAGVNALNTESTKLLDLRARLNALDATSQQAIHRVMRKIPSGKIDAQSMCDVPRLAKKLGLLSGTASQTAFGEAISTTQTGYAQNIPGSVPSALANSNFNLCLSGVGAYGAGVNASFCFAMEVVPSPVHPNRPESSRMAYKMAVVETLGGSVGMGAGVGPSVGWSPGAINTKITPFIGLEGGAGPIGAGMSWDVALKDMRATPGFSLGTGVGTPVAGSIDAGVSIPIYTGYWTSSK